MKERADNVVVLQELAKSRQKAQALIMAGLVFSEGKRIEKPGQLISLDKKLELKERLPYVSRGGMKLADALEVFKIPVRNKVAADLGASTGGFTDCLLQKGARKVYAVDVDTKQLDWQIRKDPRVVLIERNARYLIKDDFMDKIDIVTTDLSFISILKVLPAVKDFLQDGSLISLIKPQFEVGKGQVGKKGIVKDPAIHEEVLRQITKGAAAMGWKVKGLMKPSVRGQKGNQEFFIFWSLNGKAISYEELQTLIKEAVWDEKD